VSETRRNRWGQYLVVPPGGGKPVGYRRATTVAAVTDSGDSLMPWGATAAIVGALRRPGLMHRWQALIAEYPDPWYGSDESKKACKRLVEECKQAGGSTDRADIGTALHAVVELIGKGHTPILQPGIRADVDAYTAMLAATGIVVDPDLLEVTVVLDEYRVAGTVDMLRVSVPGVGELIGDLKTGTSLDYSWQSITTQLAIYARADAIYRQGGADDGSLDERRPMPNVDRAHAIIFHLPAGEARCTPHVIDIQSGWANFHRSLELEGWRKRRDLAVPLAEFVGSPSPVPHVPAAPGAPSSPAAPAVSAVAALSSSGAATATPPPFDDEPTPAPPVDPAEVRGEQVRAVRSDVPDEGEQEAPAAVEALEARYRALTADQRAWIAGLAGAAQRANVSIHLKDHPTLRRFEIVRGLVALAAADLADDETVRSLVALAVADDTWPFFAALETGRIVGALHWNEAAIFARLCDKHTSGALGVEVDTAGRVRFSDPTPAA